MQLETFMDEERLPRYAILSHTWGDDEVTFQDLGATGWKEKAGFQKIDYLCAQALEDGLEWSWVDTCCIDKSSSAELSEAINSMFRWYRKAVLCYAYLSDVDLSQDVVMHPKYHNVPLSFAKCRWFTRGWTLQELVAPSNVVFYSQEWRLLGSKHTHIAIISEITTIDKEFLSHSGLNAASVAERMAWAGNRTTTRVEDMAYCLLGIFDVNIPLLYGEGKKSFVRLQEEILRTSTDQSLLAWTGPRSSPLINVERWIERIPYTTPDMSNGEALKSEIFTQNQTSLKGLLATSPSDFLGVRGIQAFEYWLSKSRGSVSIRGQWSYIHLPAISTRPAILGNDISLVILGCRLRSERQTVLGIVLRQWSPAGFWGRLDNLVLITDTYYHCPAGDKKLTSMFQTYQIREEPRLTAELPRVAFRIWIKTEENEESLYEQLQVYCDNDARYDKVTRSVYPAMRGSQIVNGGIQAIVVLKSPWTSAIYGVALWLSAVDVQERWSIGQICIQAVTEKSTNPVTSDLFHNLFEPDTYISRPPEDYCRDTDSIHENNSESVHVLLETRVPRSVGETPLHNVWIEFIDLSRSRT